MSTIQLNIQKQIDYKTDFPIKHGAYLQIIDGRIYHADKNIRSVDGLGDGFIDYIRKSKYYLLYSSHTLLEHLMSMKLISRNMDFKSLQTAILNEFIKAEGEWYEPYTNVVNKMLRLCGRSIIFSDIPSQKNNILKSIFNNMPFILNFNYSISPESDGFFNAILVTGLIRDAGDNITGVIAHDFAGDMNSEYVNKNGKSVVYSGEVFKRIIGSAYTIGVVIEKAI